MCQIRLAIAETDKVPKARGFYDTMEETLNVAIKARGKFFSYIQGQDYSIDLDRKGRLLGVEIYASRKDWEIVPDMMEPENPGPKLIRILEHREEYEPIGFFTNKKRNLCCMRFTEEKVSYFYLVAENLVFEVNVMDELSAVWILDLIEDFGFKKEMQYRKGKSIA